MTRLLTSLGLATFLFACTSAPPAPEPMTAPMPAPTPDQSFRSTAPEPLAPRPYEFPGVTRLTLGNGLRILIAENRGAPLADVRAVVRSGADRDPADHAGLALLTANMLDEGAADRSAVDISKAVLDLGGDLSTSAGWDSSVVDLELLSRNLEEGMKIFADVLMRPTFPAKDFERVKKQTMTSLLQQKDSASIVATQRFAAFVYGDSPYGHPMNGSESSVNNISREDLARFYRDNYSPNNTSIIITGDVSTREALALVQRMFDSWKRGPAVSPVEYETSPVTANHIYVIDRPQSVQSEIRVGHAGVARSTEDYFPLLAMNTLLGGNFGSRINLNLREKHGYTYGARSQFDYRVGPGPFVVSTPVRNAVTLESVTEILSELRRIRDGNITDDELDSTKNYLMGIFPAMVETAGSLADRLEDLEVYGLPSDYFSHYRERIASVKKEDMTRVANKHVQPDKVAIVVVGRASEIREPLQKLGYPISVYDVEGKPIP